MKVALLFENFGPYHFARASAAASLMDVECVEYLSESVDYCWRRNQVSSLPLHSVVGDRSIARRFCGRPRAFMAHLEKSLASILDRMRPACVAVPGWADALASAAMIWCQRNRVPVVLMSESQETDAKRKWFIEWIKRRLVSLASTGFVGGDPHRKYLAKLGMAANAIFDGYDVVDNSYFNKGPHCDCGSCMVPSPVVRNHYFLASCRFIAKKNLSGLVSAYAEYVSQVRTECPGNAVWRLVLMGDGPLRHQLESEVISRRVQELVEFTGFVQYDSLRKYYHGASAFVHSSTTEQWGLVVNEAMASSLPVIVSDRCGCAPNLIENDVNGWTFDPQDLKHLSRLMRKVSLMTDGERSNAGRAGRSRIDQWGPERFANGLHQAVQLALADRNRSYRDLLGNVVLRTMFLRSSKAYLKKIASLDA